MSQVPEVSTVAPTLAPASSGLSNSAIVGIAIAIVIAIFLGVFIFAKMYIRHYENQVKKNYRLRQEAEARRLEEAASQGGGIAGATADEEPQRVTSAAPSVAERSAQVLQRQNDQSAQRESKQKQHFGRSIQASSEEHGRVSGAAPPQLMGSSTEAKASSALNRRSGPEHEKHVIQVASPFELGGPQAKQHHPRVAKSDERATAQPVPTSAPPPPGENTVVRLPSAETPAMLYSPEGSGSDDEVPTEQQRAAYRQDLGMFDDDGNEGAHRSGIASVTREREQVRKRKEDAPSRPLTQAFPNDSDTLPVSQRIEIEARPGTNAQALEGAATLGTSATDLFDDNAFVVGGNAQVEELHFEFDTA